MENRPKLLLTAGFLFVVAVAVTSVFSAKAQNFIGPQSSAGVGQGAIGVDSSYNLAVGTTTTQADTKLLIVGTSTTSGYFAIKVLNLNTGPLFVVRSDGSVSIGSPQIQSNQTGSLTTITGVGTAPPNGSLYVNGPIFNTLDVKTNGLAVGTTTPQSGGNILVTGSITAIGTYSGTVNAGNISAGAFGGNTGGGNFSFPASVGVGTANPGSYRLYVSGGPAFFTNEIYSSGIWSTGYGPASSGGAITFKNWTAGELARIDTATGNVGIGTANPANTTNYITLTINGTNGGMLQTQNGGTNAGIIYGNAGAFNFDTQAAKPYLFFVNGSEKVRIDSAGNVGIGTTGPSYSLDVAGNVRFSGGLAVNGQAPSATTGLTIAGTVTRGVDSQIAGTGAANYGVIGDAHGAGVGVTNYGLYGSASNGGTANYGLYINSGTSYFAGSVGIGTTSPGVKLDVIGTSANYQIARVRGTGAGVSLGYDASGNGLLGNTAFGSVVTITTTGNVGIGTGSPGAILNTKPGAVAITGLANAVSNASAFFEAGGGPSWGLSTGYVSTGNVMILQGIDKAQTTTTTIALNPYGGNIGIGTSAPNWRLDIKGTPSVWNEIGLDVDSVVYFPKVQFGTAGSFIGYDYQGTERMVLNSRYTASHYEFQVAGVEKVRIDSAGNVGIGNTAPAYKLDVTGTANFTQPILVGTPTAAGHAATKSYVDSSVSGGTSAGSFATLSVSGAWSISGAAGASLNLNGYNITGVNKLTVTTIDPVYEIGGVKYATYGADTVGLKVETYGKGTLAKNGNKNAYVIDFANAERGSDVWLFWQTIAEGANMEDVVVSLTPEGGNAQLWYVLKPEKKQIVVYGSAPVKFSYHLVAPRRDANQWKNVLVGSEEKGTVLSVK